MGDIMEIINFESIISALMLLGYETVDISLFNNALGDILMEEDFELGKKNNYLFRKVVIRDKHVFRLKNNIDINDNIIINNQSVSVKKILESSTNSKLLEYLEDFQYQKKSVR